MINEQSIEYRAGRYVVLMSYYGHNSNVARKATNLPSILATAINKVVFKDAAYGAQRTLRVPQSKLVQYLDYCIMSYREYYKSRQ